MAKGNDMQNITDSYLENGLVYNNNVNQKTSLVSDALLSINQNIGKTDKQLCADYHREYNNNKSQWIDLSYKMLSINDDMLNDLSKAHIGIKAIRVEENGLIRESLSLPSFKFMEMANEIWIESSLYNYLETQKFLFVVFRKIEKDYYLLGATIWKMSDEDLFDYAQNEWKQFKDIIVSGVKFRIEKTSSGVVVRNNFPSKNETKVLHIRPHAQAAAYKLNNGFTQGNVERDANELPNGEWMTTQSFWLNNTYIQNELIGWIETKTKEVEKTIKDSKQSIDIWNHKLSLWCLVDNGISFDHVKALYDQDYTINNLSKTSLESFNQRFGRTKTKLYQDCMEIIYGLDKTSSGIENISVNSLYAEGISKQFCERLFNTPVRFLELIDKTDLEISKVTGIGIEKSKQIKDAAKAVLLEIENKCDSIPQDERVMNDAIQENICLEDLVLHELSQGLPSITTFYLSVKLGYSLEDVQSVVSDLYKRNLIEFSSTGIKLHQLTVEDCLEMIADDRTRSIVEKKLQGLTLRQIGKEAGISGERCRKIIAKQLNHFPEVLEDRYRDIYQQYSLSYEDMSNYLGISTKEYNYLSSKYNAGKTIPGTDDLVELGMISKEQAQSIEKEKYIFIDDEKIPREKKEILLYVCKNIKGYAKSKDILEKYNQFIKLYSNQDSKLQTDETYIDHYFAELNLINCYLNGYRYYEITPERFNDLLELLDLDSYSDVIISTKKLIEQYDELKTLFDINDEYELHSILRIGMERFKPNISIKFLRMPLIQFGNVNKHDLVLDCIYQLAPIDIDEFTDFMSAEYGYKKSSFLAYLYSNFQSLIFDNKLLTEIKRPSSEEKNLIIPLLKDDLVFIEDYKKIVDSLGLSKECLTKQYIEDFGYSLYSGYMVSHKWKSAKDYFEDLILGKDVFDLKSIDKRYKTIGLFTNMLYKAEEEMSIFQFDKDTYINIRRLHDLLSVDKTFMVNYVKHICDLVDDEEFFTIDSLIDKGLDERFRQYGFKDTFYVSLFRSRADIQYSTISNCLVFRKSKESFKRSDIIESIIYSNGALSLYDLLDFLEYNLRIEVEIGDLVYYIKESNLYYNDMLEKVFIDYNQFLEEL